MTRACLSLLAGMYALQLSSFAESSDHLGTALVAALLLLTLRQFQLFIGFSLGAILFWFAATEMIEARIPDAIAGDSIVVLVNVEGLASRQGSSVSFIGRPRSEPRLPARIRLSWFEPPVNVHDGDTWQLEVRLRRPRGNRNPGGFDYESWLFRERIAAHGYVVSGRRNHLLASGSHQFIARLRARFVSRVIDGIQNPEQASILVALGVGSRHLISREQWHRYAITGTSHLMAISGLHIGLAAGMSYFAALFICGICRSGRNNHQAAILVSITAAILYAQIAGFAIPARRASLMLTLVGLALLRKRRPDFRGIFCAACIAVAVADPLATMAPGFALSFAAVAILIWVGQNRPRLVTIQSMLLFGLLPLTVMLFDRVSIAALPVNLLAVPLFSFVTVPLTLLGLLLDGPLQAIGNVMLRLAAGSVAMLEHGLITAAAFSWASFSVASLVGIAWLYIALPALWVLLPSGWPGRRLAWLGFAAVLLHRPTAIRPGCVLVNVLDVGHGLAAVIQTQRHVVLYDSGPAYRGGGSAAGNIVLPFFSSRGIDVIDRLVVSHADLDHAGGVERIQTAIPVGKISAGEPPGDVRSTPCRAGQNWFYDEVSFRFLHPEPGSVFEGNDQSCVLLLETGRYRMLFSGDIEKTAENSLIQRQVLPTVDAVIVPHHGSRTSSTAAFVRALQPSVAIVSAAYGNHWGFPKQEVVQRWEAMGARVLNTATAGAIELQICADSGLDTIRRYRVDNRRIWHE